VDAGGWFISIRHASEGVPLNSSANWYEPIISLTKARPWNEGTGVVIVGAAATNMAC